MLNHLIISDASPIIALYKIEQLHLLKDLYQSITITDVVRSELHFNIPDWILITNKYSSKNYEVLSLELDPGEASAIALAMDFPNSTLIIDEVKGRKIAKRLQLRVTGTIGLIVLAKERKIIKSGKILLDKLIESDFWLSKKIYNGVLELLGEQ